MLSTYFPVWAELFSLYVTYIQSKHKSLTAYEAKKKMSTTLRETPPHLEISFNYYLKSLFKKKKKNKRICFMYYK